MFNLQKYMFTQKFSRKYLFPESFCIRNSRNRQDRCEKTNWIEIKRTEAIFLKLLWSPGIDSKELIPPAYALVGLYNNPVPARFLAPLDCSKAP